MSEEEVFVFQSYDIQGVSWIPVLHASMAFGHPPNEELRSLRWEPMRIPLKGACPWTVFRGLHFVDGRPQGKQVKRTLRGPKTLGWNTRRREKNEHAMSMLANCPNTCLRGMEGARRYIQVVRCVYCIARFCPGFADFASLPSNRRV